MLEQFLKYFWVVTVLFLAAAAVLAARLSGDLIAQRLWVAEVDQAPTAARDEAPVIRERLSDYRIIEERNLFNAHPKPAPAPAAPTDHASAPATPAPATPVARAPLDIRLLGTAVIEGGRSFAVIEVERDTKVVHEGEEVAADTGATLVQVLPDRIRVKRGEDVEEILLSPPEEEKPAQSRARARRSKTRPQPPAASAESDTVRQVGDNKWLIDRREVEEATANMSRLMTQLRVVPNFTDGQPDGFKVFAIRPGSLFAKLGLKNGDVVKRINGVEIQGPEQAFEAYQRLKDETSIQIDLTRSRENQTFSYEIR